MLVVAVAVERLIEVRVAERNRAVSKTHGGVELGAGHYPAMVALHFSLLVGCLVEPIVGGSRPWAISVTPALSSCRVRAV